MTAIVKLIHNGGQPTYYTLKVQDNHVWLDLHMQNIPGDFLTMIIRLKDDLIFKKPYKVIFNVKSIAQDIRCTKEFLRFKEDILKLLGKSSDPNQDTWIEILKLHIAKGKCPSFQDYDDPTTLVKISNYFQSILNTTITKAQVIELCQKLINTE